MSELKSGDVVRLKSGGPAMTVSNLLTVLDKVQCVWFIGSNLQNETFSTCTLNVLENYNAEVSERIRKCEDLQSQISAQNSELVKKCCKH